MQIQKLLAIALVGKQFFLAGASWTYIAGYKPGSKVTSHNAIDLDQLAIENALAAATIDYTAVKNIYQQGGNSKTYALLSVPAIPSTFTKGDMVVQGGVSGKMYSTYAKGSTEIKVAYATSDVQASYVGCKGGALPAATSGTKVNAMMPYKLLGNGCFKAAQLKVTTSSGDIEVTPTSVTNQAGRTLQGFSTKAKGTMYEKDVGCKGASNRATDRCPYTDFKQYYDYYGNFDYANKFVLAAINKGPTSFTNTAGNMDFTGRSDSMRKECIKKGTAYMNAYMYAIREYEDAIDDCKAGCPGGATDTSKANCNSLSVAAVHAWDEGVAFYTGSLEGPNAGGSTNGKLSYRVAEKRCANFKTCGDNGDSVTGISAVNIAIFKQLAIGQDHLLKGKCDLAIPVVRTIVAHMAIPLIQGTLRYAYKVDKLKGEDKEKGEGAVFAAAIVPRVAACNTADAAVIMNNMKIGATSTDFAAVKKAFENQYTCMDITCAQVGGLWFSAQNKYYDGACPCGVTCDTKSPTQTETKTDGAHPSSQSVAWVVIVMTMIFGCRGQ